MFLCRFPTACLATRCSRGLHSRTIVSTFSVDGGRQQLLDRQKRNLQKLQTLCGHNSTTNDYTTRLHGLKNVCPASRSSAMFLSNSSTPDVHTALERLQQLEDSLRYHGYSTVRIALSLLALIGVTVYMFRESLRDNVAEEVSQVASRSLEDEMVIGKVEVFAKSLLHAIGHDDKMKTMAANFMKEVIQREETGEAVKTLVINVLNDHNTRQQLGQAFRELIVKAVSDKSTQAALKEALQVILQDDATKEVVKDLLRSVFTQADVVDFTSSFFKEVIKSELVVQQATTLGKQVTQDVITDPNIQEATSNTLWRAVKMSVTPRWFNGKSGKPGNQTTEGE